MCLERACDRAAHREQARSHIGRSDRVAGFVAERELCRINGHFAQRVDTTNNRGNGSNTVPSAKAGYASLISAR